MKILGIGNAIVDVLCRVDDEFLTKNSLTKSTMKLIDEKEFKNETLEVNVKDYYFSNVIARSSKTMIDCNNSKINLKSTGTEG